MKRQTKNPIVLWMALCLFLPYANSCAVAQEKPDSKKADGPKTALASSLVTVTANEKKMAGVILKADDRTALILTTFQWSSRHDNSEIPTGQKVTVTIASRDGKSQQIEGVVQELIGQVQDQDVGIWYTVIVEIQHAGLEQSAVPLAETVPKKGDKLTVLCRLCVDAEPSGNLSRATVAADIDPTQKQDLLGQLNAKNLLRESFLTVHDDQGTLAGIAMQSRTQWRGGTGFFSIPDLLSNSDTNDSSLSPVTFISVVDFAQELRRNGIRVSDAAIALQKRRRRIHRDAVGRPITTKNLQITWSDDHKELHGYSHTLGEWAKLSIEEQDEIYPVLDTGVAAVSLPGKIAAYSPVVGRWDVMTLRPGSKMPPSVSDNIATVQDGKNYYTFAASTGIWTSPTDANYQKHSIQFQVGNANGSEKLLASMQATNNRAVVTVVNGLMTITGPRHHVVDAERLAKTAYPNNTRPASNANTRHNLQPSAAGLTSVATTSGPGIPSHKANDIDQQSLDLARKIRDVTLNNDAANPTDVQKLKALVTASFEQRLQKQKAAASGLKKKLQAIEQAVQSREANRQKIIERRIEELVDPSINWSTLQPAAPKHIPYGMPRIGTPAGLPGPAHSSVNIIAQAPTAVDGDSGVTHLLNSLKRVRNIAVHINAPVISVHRTAMSKFQKPIETLQKLHGENFSDEDQKEAIQTSKDNIIQSQKSFKEAYSVWDLTWEQYESIVQSKQQDVEQCSLQADLEKSKFERVKKLADREMISTSEFLEFEVKIKLKQIELQRAQSELAILQKIATDFPHLNPKSFDTTELLKPVAKENPAPAQPSL